jgi:hypothetical protein
MFINSCVGTSEFCEAEVFGLLSTRRPRGTLWLAKTKINDVGTLGVNK